MIRTHLQTSNSPIIVDNFSILGSTDNNVDLRILESLESPYSQNEKKTYTSRMYMDVYVFSF